MDAPFLSLQTRPQYAAVRAAQTPRVLYALLDVAPAQSIPAARAPVNLVLGIDASHSMLVPALDDSLIDELNRAGLLTQTMADGIPVYVVHNLPPELRPRARMVSSMDYVQAALGELFARLDQNDRLAVVAFATDARVVIANGAATSAARPQALAQALSGGQLGDETLLAPALPLCLEEARKGQSPHHVTRIVLLTDGFVRDEQAALAEGQRILQQAISISTIGLGLAFNEGFLIHLAESTGGSAQLVFAASDIPALFRSELEATQTTLVRRLRVTWRATPGVEVRRIFRLRPLLAQMQPDEGSSTGGGVLVGDLLRDRPAALLLELVMPPRPPGIYRLLQIAAHGQPPGQHAACALAATDLLLHVLAADADEPAPDATVMQMVQAATTFQLQTRALDEAASGQQAAALQSLHTVKLRLEAQGDAAQARAVAAEAAQLARRGHLSDEGAKRLRYATRTLAPPPA